MTKKSASVAATALPPGSFDVQKLSKGLGKTIDVKPEERAAAQSKAIEEASGSKAGMIDQGARPDQKRVEVKRAGQPSESVLVHDPKSEAAKNAAEAADDIAKRQAEQQQLRADAIASADSGAAETK